MVPVGVTRVFWQRDVITELFLVDLVVEKNQTVLAIFAFYINLLFLWSFLADFIFNIWCPFISFQKGGPLLKQIKSSGIQCCCISFQLHAGLTGIETWFFGTTGSTTAITHILGSVTHSCLLLISLKHIFLWRVGLIIIFPSLFLFTIPTLKLGATWTLVVLSWSVKRTLSVLDFLGQLLQHKFN